MKSDGEIMNIPAAYDLTGSVRSAAELVGCSHHTVAAHVAARDAGRAVGAPARRLRNIDAFLDKIEEWVEASKGRIRADVAHEKLVALGFGGSDRSTRRAVAEVKKSYRLGHARVHRPWVTEPGMWLQYDFGDGPVVDGVKTVLFVAWLAWSRFRVVWALKDRTQPSVIAALDRTFRLLGGVPTYVLTDNEKTVTTEHVAGVPVRNRETVSFGRHYGVSVLTCQPADPASKGGVEASVKVAKADLVPTVTAQVNGRVHRVTRRAPVEMLAEEGTRLHRVPDDPHMVVFGLARRVPANTPMVSFEHGGQCSGVVEGFVLDGRAEPELAVEAAVVVPVDVLGDGDLEVVDARPGASVADQFGFDQGVERFGHRVVVGVAAGADGGDRDGVGDPFGVADGAVLGEFNRSMQHRAVGVSVAVRRRPRRGFSSRGSCGVGC